MDARASRTLIPQGTRRTRARRRSAAGQYYHIITCTAGRNPLFANFHVGRHVVKSLKRLHREDVATTLAFVVMPDHVHWLMQLSDTKRLPVCVGSMKSFAARNIVKAGHPGRRIWQQGYVDRAIRREPDLVRVARYIVANPLRAGLVDTIGDWPLWDSVWIESPA